MNDELTWSVEESGTSVVLLVRGVLTRKSGMALDAVLRKLLLDRGRLLVDVSALCAVARCAAILGGPAKRLRPHRGTWRPPWAVGLNARAIAMHTRFVRDFTGFDRPWRLLLDYVPDLHVREIELGCGYPASGTTRSSTCDSVP